MRLLLVALLAAISYAQTAGGAAAGGMGGMGGFDPMMMNGIYDEVMDMGDMYPEYGDLFDNIGYMMGNLGMGGAGAGGAPGAGGAAGGGMGGMMGGMGGMFGDYGDINDIMSDVVDNMKDGDIYDVMQNVAPLAQMGLPGIDMSSFFGPSGMPDMNGIMQGLSPYLAMDGDFYGDFGDFYGFASDMYEDYMKYGGMGGMGGGMGMGMGGAPMALRKNHMNHKRHRARKPSRLLKSKKHLTHTREFPFFGLAGGNTGGQAGSTTQNQFPFGMFDAPDSEDIATFLMMGGNRNAIPPPLDGIDNEDFWMYRGTKWDPLAMFNKATTTTNADGTQTQSANPWLYALLSGLQKRHMQKKY